MRIGHRSPALARHPVAPGLRGYEEVEVHSDPGEFPYAITATVKARGGKYVVTRLVVEETEGGPTVQRGELAKISVDPFIRAAAAHVTEEKPGSVPGHSTLSVPGPPDEFWDRVQHNGISDEDLPQLAALYRWIRLQEGKPTAVLAEEIGVSTATVRRWLIRAVEAGYLTQEERTK